MAGVALPYGRWRSCGRGNTLAFHINSLRVEPKLLTKLLLMVQKSCGHQLREVGSLSHYLQGFSTITGWLFGISEPSTVAEDLKQSTRFHSNYQPEDMVILRPFGMG